MFIYLRNDGKQAARSEALKSVGHPVLEYAIQDVSSLGAEFYRWEFATSILCAVIGVNAFDQPDVQDSKTRTMEKIKTFAQTGKLEEGNAIWEELGIRAFSTMSIPGHGIKESLQGLLREASQPEEREPKGKRSLC